jgi:GNAT superfamily N-acetyltransferase
VTETEVVTSGDRHDLDDETRAALGGGWPEFIFHDPLVKQYLKRVERFFGYYDILLLARGSVVAGGWGVPIRWNGAAATLPAGGYNGAMASSVTGHENSVPADTLCIMAAAVKPGHLGTGLAGQVLTALRERAAETGLSRVVAPVRPTLKTRYPLTSMSQFARWTRGDGLHIDPWIRTHQRMGARILRPARRSMIITGTVAEWEDWTKMAFPQTGRYVVPDALDLVHIDREADLGTYAETNLWMRHL